jgi:hypothetical protein
MGFSIEMFFTELANIAGADMQDQDKLTCLLATIEENKQYAIECGVIEEEK